MPATKPKIGSLNTSISTAVIAPRPLSRINGDWPSKSEINKIHNTDKAKSNGLHEPAHRKMLRQIAAEQISLQRVEQRKNSKQAKHQAPNIGERNQTLLHSYGSQLQLHRQQHALNGERQIAKQPLLAQNIQKSSFDACKRLPKKRKRP